MNEFKRLLKAYKESQQKLIAMKLKSQETIRQEMITKENHTILLKFLRALSKQQDLNIFEREIIYLHYIRGWTVRDISKYMTYPINTLYTIFKELKEKIKAMD
jgi:DNA-directed RNA polymerase specialized sigma24 family protein